MGIVDGVGDSLNTFIGGNIAGTRVSRFENRSGKSADPHIPSNLISINGIGIDTMLFKNSVNKGYGNGSTADYLAESFAYNILNRDNVPIHASIWVDQTIISQAASLP